MARLGVACSLSFALVGCSLPGIDLTGKGCPCAPGWECDDVRNECVPRAGAGEGGTDAARMDAAGIDAAGVDARVDAREREDATIPDAGGADVPPIDPDAGTLGPFGVPMELSGVESPMNDDDPSMTADGLELYFDSDRIGSDGDIFVAVRPDTSSSFGTPTRLSISTTEDETGPHVSPDGLSLYFSAQRAGALRSIYVSRRASRTDPWGPEARVDEVSSTGNDSGPSVTADGLALYFRSDRAGAGGVYVATRASTDDPWSTPVVVPELDASGEPSISADGLVIASSLAGASEDLYLARRPDRSSPFGPPEPIAELNTAAAEFDAWISPDLRTLLFTTDRDGDWAIWIATR